MRIATAMGAAADCPAHIGFALTDLDEYVPASMIVAGIVAGDLWMAAGDLPETWAVRLTVRPRCPDPHCRSRWVAVPATGDLPTLLGELHRGKRRDGESLTRLRLVRSSGTVEVRRRLASRTARTREGAAVEDAALWDSAADARVVWLDEAQRRTVREMIARRGEATEDAEWAGAALELAAAEVRARWFESAAAAGFRMVANLPREVVPVTFEPAEVRALLSEDLDDDLRAMLLGEAFPAGPLGGVRGAESPEIVDSGPAAQGTFPVLALSGGRFAWHCATTTPDGCELTRLGEADVSMERMAAAAAALRVTEVDCAGARRLLTRPAALASAALYSRRWDLDVAAVLALPDVVVLAPTALAQRVARYCVPVAVAVLTASDAARVRWA